MLFKRNTPNCSFGGNSRKPIREYSPMDGSATLQLDKQIMSREDEGN